MFKPFSPLYAVLSLLALTTFNPLSAQNTPPPRPQTPNQGQSQIQKQGQGQIQGQGQNIPKQNIPNRGREREQLADNGPIIRQTLHRGSWDFRENWQYDRDAYLSGMNQSQFDTRVRPEYGYGPYSYGSYGNQDTPYLHYIHYPPSRNSYQNGNYYNSSPTPGYYPNNQYPSSGYYQNSYQNSQPYGSSNYYYPDNRF